MVRRYLTLIACCVGIGHSSVPSATAEKLWEQKDGGWSVSAHTREGTFSHCASSGRYKSGILLVFSVDKNLRWAMALSDTRWHFTVGSKYPISYRVDSGASRTVTASAYLRHAVEAPLENSMELFNQFRSGQILYVRTAQANFEFKLTNTSQMLATVLQCAQAKGQRSQTAVASSNPFESPAARSQATDRSALVTEATLFAANLVSALGITGFTFLKPNEIPRVMIADAAWKTSAGFGAVAIMTKTKEASSLLTSIITFDSRDCKGAFASGSLPADGFTRLFTKCGSGNDGIVAYYVIVPRASGGFYVVSTYTRDNPEAAELLDADIRTAVFKALPR
jgi:hypothetical protein